MLKEIISPSLNILSTWHEEDTESFDDRGRQLGWAWSTQEGKKSLAWSKFAFANQLVRNMTKLIRALSVTVVQAYSSDCHKKANEIIIYTLNNCTYFYSVIRWSTYNSCIIKLQTGDSYNQFNYVYTNLFNIIKYS